MARQKKSGTVDKPKKETRYTVEAVGFDERDVKDRCVGAKTIAEAKWFVYAAKRDRRVACVVVMDTRGDTVRYGADRETSASSWTVSEPWKYSRPGSHRRAKATPPSLSPIATAAAVSTALQHAQGAEPAAPDEPRAGNTNAEPPSDPDKDEPGSPVPTPPATDCATDVGGHIA